MRWNLFDFRNESTKSSRIFIAGCAFFLALLQGLSFVLTQWLFTQSLCLPLDDSFIHAQYAKQIAHGQYFQYQQGDPVSSGETSFLYAHILAIGFLLGLSDSGIILWIHSITLLCITGVFFYLFRLSQLLNGAKAGLFVVALVFSSGHLGWAFWSGMEIALFTLLILACYHAIFIKREYPFILMGLLAMCRPEGFIIVAAIMGLSVLGRFFNLNVPPLQFRKRWTWFALVFLALAIAGPPLFYRIATGQSGGNGLLAKSLLYDPNRSLIEMIGAFVTNIGDIFYFLIGHPSSTPSIGYFILPGLLIFAGLGLAGLIIHNFKEKAILLGIPLGLALMAVATLEVWQLHSFRYIAPFVPILILVGVDGLFRIFSFLPVKQISFTASLLLIGVLFQFSYYPDWLTQFAHQSTTIHEKQVSAAQWLNQHLLPEPVAINDAGALAYFGNKKILDLVGLVTNDLTLPYRMGEGGLYEALETLPPSRRPMFAAIFPLWFEEMAQTYDIFHYPLVSFPDPFDNSFKKVIYHFNWSYAGMEDQPREATLRPGWEIKDALDVASRESEVAHEYSFEIHGDGFPDIAVPFRRNFGYHEEIDLRWPNIENEQRDLIPRLKEQGLLNHYDIVDVGRRITGEELFKIENLEPDKPVHIIMRTCDNSGRYENFSYRMQVLVSDIYAGEWIIEGTSWNWYESKFTIPAKLVKSESLRIRIINMGNSSFSYYDSYYYWICQ